MNEDIIHDCAKRVVEVVAEDFPQMAAPDALMSLFGAALMISRVIGLSDHDLHQGFGSFLEDNRE